MHQKFTNPTQHFANPTLKHKITHPSFKRIYNKSFYHAYWTNIWIINCYLAPQVFLLDAPRELTYYKHVTLFTIPVRESQLENPHVKLSTLPTLRLLSSKTQERKDSWKLSKPRLVGILWKALVEYSQNSTHVPGFQSFFRFFAPFCIGQISQQHHKG